MIELNNEQAKFYDSISTEDDKQEQTGYATHKRANLLTRMWASLRYKQQEAFTESGLEVRKEKFHQQWIDAKSHGNFLELGCFRGTRSSWPLIASGGNYLLDHKAKAVAVDFLVMEEDKTYDLIFAHGVLHHFENPAPLFEKINKLLKPDGILLLTEPSQINPLYRVIRSIYRPFQSDSAWEWPFTDKTVAAMETYLKPVDGFGWGRFSLLISILNGMPLIGAISKPIYIRLLKGEVDAGWHSKVWSNSTVTAAYVKK
jgi:SAM-dependent methyltransferase